MVRFRLGLKAGCDPKAVDGIRQEQYLDPARAEALELRRTLKAAKVRSGRVVDRRLVLFD